MRDYEVTVLIKGDLEDKEVDAWVKSFEALLGKSSGKVNGKLDSKKKPTAYEIRKGVREAYYVYGEVALDTDKVSPLENALKTDDSVMRYLVIKKA